MNERIKELYNKAWSKVDPRNPQETFTQAFAELIVRECCDQFDKHPYVGTKRTQYIYGYIQGRVDAEQQIKQHFGVE